MARRASDIPLLEKVEVEENGDVADVVLALRDLLGSELTAQIAGVHDARTVDAWARGERQPRPVSVRRLRDGLRISSMLLEIETAAIVRAWFGGMNPLLGDRSPASVVGHDLAAVERAARAFRAYG